MGQVLKFPSAAGEHSLEEGFPPFWTRAQELPTSICMRRACRSILPVECEAGVGGQASESPAVCRALHLGDVGAFLVINKATLVPTVCDRLCSSLCQDLEEKESPSSEELHCLWEDRDTMSV